MGPVSMGPVSMGARIDKGTDVAHAAAPRVAERTADRDRPGAMACPLRSTRRPTAVRNAAEARGAAHDEVEEGRSSDRLHIEERCLIEELPLRGGIFFPTEAVPVQSAWPA